MMPAHILEGLVFQDASILNNLYALPDTSLNDTVNSSQVTTGMNSSPAHPADGGTGDKTGRSNFYA
jgi:hypothetical protein